MRFFAFLLPLIVFSFVSSAEQALELGAEVPEGTGQDWTLPDEQMVNLQIIDKQFHLLFLDEERLIMEPSIEKAIVRGEEARNRTNELNLVLRAGSGATLTHVRKVFPPYDFWLRILVPNPEEEDDWISLSRLRYRPKASE